MTRFLKVTPPMLIGSSIFISNHSVVNLKRVLSRLWRNVLFNLCELPAGKIYLARQTTSPKRRESASFLAAPGRCCDAWQPHPYSWMVTYSSRFRAQTPMTAPGRERLFPTHADCRHLSKVADRQMSAYWRAHQFTLTAKSSRSGAHAG